MCIDLRDNHSEPYNKSRIRYKRVQIDDGEITSLTANSFVWKPLQWHKATDRSRIDQDLCSYRKEDIGFHCYITKKDAKGDDNVYIATVEVKGFVASGFSPGGSDCETWKYAKLIGLETMGGHRNIVKRFIK